VSGKHAPNRFGKYIAIHETAMAKFRRKGLVEGDTLVLKVAGSSYLLMTGKIHCAGGIIIDVDKTLEILDGLSASKVLHGHADDALVQNIEYSYNARIVLPGRVVGLFRYDNAHHPDEHHRHAFTWPDGRRGTTTAVNPHEYPTLAEAIIEAQPIGTGNTGMKWSSSETAVVPRPRPLHLQRSTSTAVSLISSQLTRERPSRCQRLTGASRVRATRRAEL
jgi:hypothetical protein